MEFQPSTLFSPTITFIHSIVCRLLNRCGLESAAHNLIGGVTFKGISGGQRRRLSIAEQLLVSPSILLLDEPTSGLDGTSSLKLVRLLKGCVPYLRHRVGTAV